MIFSTIFLFTRQGVSQKSYDSLKIETPKHYFNTLLVIDGYGKPSKNMKDTADVLNKRLKSYGVKQVNLSFCTPLYTKDEYSKDSSRISNHHILLTGNYNVLKPIFSGISDHKLVKLGIGLRYIYNTGKKGVLFADIAPFITRDATYASKAYFRLASTMVYSYNINENFNWRLGITKSFMWGNRYYLPFIGFRIGKLDKLNLSIQFPRSISVNFPINPSFILKLYTAPQGGMYNFSNHDTLYFNKTTSTFHFTRYEINTGLRADIRVSNHFNFYLATGFSTQNNITFYSEKANKNRPRLSYLTYFYSEKIAPSLYLNFGLVFKLGHTKSYYKNRNVYDAINLNNTLGTDNGNAQIPLAPKILKDSQNLKSIQDLIDYNDF